MMLNVFGALYNLLRILNFDKVLFIYKHQILYVIHSLNRNLMFIIISFFY